MEMENGNGKGNFPMENIKTYQIKPFLGFLLLFF